MSRISWWSGKRSSSGVCEERGMGSPRRIEWRTNHIDRTRKSALASQVIFDDQNLDDEVPQGAGDEFEEAKPLAEELIDTLIDLLFFADFTLPKSPTSKSKVTYAIWQSGVGCNTAIGTSKEFESNRCEILRLLLTLTSKVSYEI